MEHRAFATSEPVVQGLIEAVCAWQAALEQALSDFGISYTKWLLLRAIACGDFIRHQAYRGQILIDADLSERLLEELHAHGWIELAEAPRIADSAHGRLERVWQAVKALHSVSVAAFNPQERAALSALLRRMSQTLGDHTARRRKHGTPAPVPA